MEKIAPPDFIYKKNLLSHSCVVNMSHIYTMGQPLAICESMDLMPCDTIRFEVHFVHQFS